MLKLIGNSLLLCLNPRMLRIVLMPIAVALLLWIVLSILFWRDAATWIGSGVGSWLGQWIPWGSSIGAVAAHVALFLAVAIATLATSAAITAVFGMPAIVAFVAGREFPTLARRAGGSFAGSVANATIALGVFLPLWILSLPLWLFGPVGIAVQILLSALLNQRLFRYDALAEHATRAEIDAIIAGNRRRLFLLGVGTACVALVPFVNLLAPTCAGIAFTRFCLGELAAVRGREQP
jgi:uncharacterized protein involved in cysteine biosynthesis